MSNFTTPAIQEEFSDEPRPIIRESENAIQAMTIANADREISEIPILRSVVPFISAMLSNDPAEQQPADREPTRAKPGM